MRRLWVPFAIAGAIAVVALFAFSRLNPGALNDGDNVTRLIWAAGVLVLIGPFAFSGGLSRTLRQLAQWAVVLAALTIGYQIWQDGGFSWAGLRAAFSPQLDSADQAGIAQFRANSLGEFVVEGDINGTRVMFLVDTGASDLVLAPRDAERVGFDLATLDYPRVYDTASGTVRAAPVRLDQVSVGGVAVDNVRAAVSSFNMDTSLLGMSFINRLSGFELRNGVLTLHQ